ncbi:MAG: hypothetical protein HRT72_10735 [Flavobacteriales bacterium]|nr:hypothetical protein [Flavobacteriales bacterium]
MGKLLLGFVSVAVVLSRCDKEYTIERDDVIRFDRNLTVYQNTVVFNDTVLDPYSTEELAQYADQRDQIQRFGVTDIQVRVFSCSEDHADNKIEGYITMHGESSDIYELELYSNGDEYKDGQSHSII